VIKTPLHGIYAGVGVEVNGGARMQNRRGEGGDVLGGVRERRSSSGKINGREGETLEAITWVCGEKEKGDERVKRCD
jgi:hypothetical protein